LHNLIPIISPAQQTKNSFTTQMPLKLLLLLVVVVVVVVNTSLHHRVQTGSQWVAGALSLGGKAAGA
jgi:hypothetical protein